ncbi:MAG: universal stress protein [Anaerolineae bacterium]
MRILICTDGSKYAEEAIRFGGFIAKGAKAHLTLLGVIEGPDEAEKVRKSLERARDLLAQDVSALETKTKMGHAAEEILSETEEREYDLVVVGSRGRRGITRFLLGSTAARIVQHTPISVLIVKGKRPSLRNILICTGGEERGEEDVRFGGMIARSIRAQVTILHVMSQLPLTPEARLEDLEATEEELLRQETREGVHLRKGLQILKELGVAGEVKIRRGLVVNEILAEAEEGDYDLLVIGAHAAPGLYRFLLDDLTTQIVLGSPRPVLVVKPKGYEH